MTWLTFAILGYGLLAIESVISKYLLVGRLKSWRLYTFYVGILSLFTIILSPLGIECNGLLPFLITFFSGIIFYISLCFLFNALLHASADRVYILQGASLTLLTLVLSALFLKESMYQFRIVAIFFLVIGGLLIAYRFHHKTLFAGWQKVIIAALLASISLIMLKYSYGGQNFIAGYVFNRVGIFSGAILSLALPSFRKDIFNSWKKKSVHQNTLNVIGTIIAKTIAGSGMVMINYGVYLGSVAVVSALVSVQYLFTFLFVFILSHYFRKIFNQHLTWKNILLKIAGIILVILGTVFVFL
jgi:drug/metabolite transporter (DMT)-like permease